MILVSKSNKRKSLIYIMLTTLFVSHFSLGFSQKSQHDSIDYSSILKNVIVEKYYVASPEDRQDTTGGIIPKGSKTYRIYVHLEDGYALQAVYGVQNQVLKIETSTYFFKNSLNPSTFGYQINDSNVSNKNIIIDSWLTIGAVSNKYIGIPKKVDTIGSIYSFKELGKSDGLKECKTSNTIIYGFDMQNLLGKNQVSKIETEDGMWAVPQCVSQNNNNYILIAHLTTTGKISFALNLQVKSKDNKIINLVAKNPKLHEIECKILNY